MNYQEKLSSMIKVNTVSVPKETGDYKEFRELLKELFPNVFLNEVLVIKGSILIIWKGKSSDNPILLMNHHDTVPAKGDWLYPPFDGVITDDKIYGRGTLDTKGGLFMMLEASEELMSEGFIPNNDVYLLSTADEETHGYGSFEVAKYLEENNVHFRYVLDEGGFIMNSPFSGVNGNFALIGVGEKGFCDIKFTAKSVGGHASIPERNTPLVRLGKFMAYVDTHNPFKVEINSTLKELFRRLSKGMKGITRLLLSHPVLFHPILKAFGPKISPAINAMFRTTICFTEAKGSEGINVVPSVAYVTGNMRFSHHEGKEESIEIFIF